VLGGKIMVSDGGVVVLVCWVFGEMGVLVGLGWCCRNVLMESKSACSSVLMGVEARVAAQLCVICAGVSLVFADVVIVFWNFKVLQIREEFEE